MSTFETVKPKTLG